MRTEYYNPDGSNMFRSKIQFCLVFPAAIITLAVIFLHGLPILSNDFVKTEISLKKIDFGIEGIQNSSNYKSKPISPLYV